MGAGVSTEPPPDPPPSPPDTEEKVPRDEDFCFVGLCGHRYAPRFLFKPSLVLARPRVDLLDGGRCTPRENAINIIPFLLPVRAFRSCKKPPQYAHGAMAGAGIH